MLLECLGTPAPEMECNGIHSYYPSLNAHKGSTHLEATTGPCSTQKVQDGAISGLTYG